MPRGLLGRALALPRARASCGMRCRCRSPGHLLAPMADGTRLRHGEAPHPEWRPTEPWSENVSSYAIDDGARLLLFDPLAVPSELGDLAAARETAIVLTAPWHERDAQSLVERLGVPVYTPLPDTAQDLLDK